MLFLSELLCFFFNFLFPIISGLYPCASNIFFTFYIQGLNDFSQYVQQLQGGKFLLNEMVAVVPVETRTSVDNLKFSANFEVPILLRGVDRSFPCNVKVG